MKTIVINLISAPGAGKSVLAADIFSALKKMNIKCELVTEYVKPLVYRKKFAIMDDQFFISKEQYKLLKAIDGQMQFIVTDTCLMSGIQYNRNNKFNHSNIEMTEKAIVEWYSEFNNVNLFLKRGDFVYEPQGREQKTVEEADKIHDQLVSIMDEFQVSYAKVDWKTLDMKALIEFILTKAKEFD